MVLQVEDHFVHRDASLEQHAARLIQNKACHETQHQVTIIGVFTVDLAGIGGQHMLEDTEHLFDQIATGPDVKSPRGGNL